jgi:hypothetical protein
MAAVRDIGGPYLVSAIVLFALTRAYILFAFQPQASDLSVYFGNAVLVADLGKTPYTADPRGRAHGLAVSSRLFQFPG